MAPAGNATMCSLAPVFSSVYVIFGFLVIVCFGILTLLIQAYGHVNEVAVPFSTVSALGAYPTPGGRRHLFVAASFLAAISLASLHVEEFFALHEIWQVRSPSIEDWIFFGGDIASAVLVIFIGVFHTAGHENSMKLRHLSWCKPVPVIISTILHYVGIVALFVWNPASCTRSIIRIGQHDEHFIMLAILVGLSWLFLAIFAVILFIGNKRKSVVYQLSYTFEALTAITVIVTTALFSIHRNPHVKFFGSDECPPFLRGLHLKDVMPSEAEEPFNHYEP